MDKQVKWANIVQILWPHDNSNIELTEKLTVLTILVYSCALTFLIMFSSLLLIKDYSAVFYTDLLGLITCTLMPLAYRVLRRSYTLTATFTLLDAVLIINVMCYKTGGIHSSGTIWFVIMPAIAGFTLEKKGAIWGGVANICSVLFLYYAVSEYATSGLNDIIIISKLRALIISSTIISIIIYLAQNDIKQKMKSIQIGNDNSNKLLNVLSKDIQNPLSLIEQNSSTIISALKMCKSDQEPCHKCSFTKQTARIEKASRLIREIIVKAGSHHVLNDGKDNKLELKPVNLITTINNAIFILSENIEKKLMKVVVNNKCSNEIIVTADDTSLTSQVFSNLISNAIKFSTHNSEITIDVEQLPDNKALITITDRGIGIPKQLQGIIFSPTHKTSRLGTDGEKGTGFGMPLVKKYIDYYGGSIDVESRTADMFPSDHGTTFKIKLNSYSLNNNLKEKIKDAA